MPSICPDGPPELLGCIPEDLFCNLESNCPGGLDEVGCMDYGNHITLPCIRMQLLYFLLHSGFVPFGGGAGDSSGRVGDDENAVTVLLPIAVVFYERRITEIHVI